MGVVVRLPSSQDRATLSADPGEAPMTRTLYRISWLNVLVWVAIPVLSWTAILWALLVYHG